MRARYVALVSLLFAGAALAGIAGGALERETAVIGIPFVVTNVEDDGPGSLRQAIIDVNQRCTSPEGDPCSIVFAIDGPMPPEGWFTIRPKTPLPVIVGAAVAKTSHRRSRPEVLLDGSLLANGDGLSFRGRYAYVSDLAIGGFPGNGVTSTALTSVTRSYVGVDPTGMRALPNGARGVALYGGDSAVTDSILSANGHAGGFFWVNGSMTLLHNRVGVGADGVTPLGNGASGLFLHNPLSFADRFSDVRDNVIAYNHHAGLAMTAFIGGNLARNVMFRNHNGAIDIDLDGPTLAPKPGIPGVGGVLGAPEIVSARYENGATIIEGRLSPRVIGATVTSDEVYVYANADDAADAMEIVGTLEVTGPAFRLRVERDLRASFVTAAETIVYWYTFEDTAPATSEVSLPRPVL